MMPVTYFEMVKTQKSMCGERERKREGERIWQKHQQNAGFRWRKVFQCSLHYSINFKVFMKKLE